jgi:release factor glutamine methyltransferase
LWRSLWAETTDRLGGRYAEARWICEEASGYEGSEWAGALDEPARTGAVARLDALVARRLAGEPIQYVLGHWGFRRLDLLVDQRVLIPRPETELVVEVALEEASRLGRPLVVADLGTGSGAIALALADELGLRDVEIWASDASEEALHVARANLAGIGRAGVNVRIALGRWFGALPVHRRGRLDLVVSNPPYIAEGDPEVDDAVRAWEPASALFAGAAGLDAVDEIVTGAVDWLRPGGALVMEIGARQGDAAIGLASGAGFSDAAVRPDLAGADRVLVAHRAT